MLRERTPWGAYSNHSKTVTVRERAGDGRTCKWIRRETPSDRPVERIFFERLAPGRER